jgi:hypothetical protein
MVFLHKDGEFCTGADGQSEKGELFRANVEIKKSRWYSRQATAFVMLFQNLGHCGLIGSIKLVKNHQ